MAETSYPFDSGGGTSVDEDAWRAMAQHWVPSGVIGASTRDTADTSLKAALGSGGAGPIFQMAAGEAFVSGIKYRNDATLTKTQAANGNSNPRIDRLALKLDTTANTCVAVVITGTPAASPVSPSFPDTSTVLHLPIARATCPGSGSAQNYSNLVDERLFVGARRFVGPWSAGLTLISPGDEWLRTDTVDRVLRVGSKWVGTRQRIYNAVPRLTTGSEPISADNTELYGTITVPDLGYDYQISFNAHMQISGMPDGGFVIGTIREDNQTSGTIRAEGTGVSVNGLDAPLSLPGSKAVTIAAGAAHSWYLRVFVSNAASWSWTSAENWFTATVTPVW